MYVNAINKLLISIMTGYKLKRVLFRSILYFLFICVTDTIYAQMSLRDAYTSYSKNSKMLDSYSHTEYLADARMNPNLKLIGKSNDSTYYFTYTGGRYLGGAKIKNDYISLEREGWGIERFLVYRDTKPLSKMEKKSSNKIYEYYIGEWLNNQRHGNGFFMDMHGRMYAGIWKKGYLKGKTKRKLTFQEQEYIKHAIEQIDNIIIK